MKTQILLVLGLYFSLNQTHCQNIIVNDNDEIIRKNRLELLQMFCRTFENYINFSKIESA